MSDNRKSKKVAHTGSIPYYSDPNYFRNRQMQLYMYIIYTVLYIPGEPIKPVPLCFIADISTASSSKFMKFGALLPKYTLNASIKFYLSNSKVQRRHLAKIRPGVVRVH